MSKTRPSAFKVATTREGLPEPHVIVVGTREQGMEVFGPFAGYDAARLHALDARYTEAASVHPLKKVNP